MLKIIVAKISIKKIKKSLNLLNEKALKAAFKVPALVAQKLIRRKEVSPISSHPKNNTTRLPANTSRSILATKEFKNKRRRSTLGS